MRKEDNDYDLKKNPIVIKRYDDEINTSLYNVKLDLAALEQSILLLVDAINDKGIG